MTGCPPYEGGSFITSCPEGSARPEQFRRSNADEPVSFVAAAREPDPVSGWCAECAAVGGQYVLATDPSGWRCTFHARFDDQSTGRPVLRPTWPPEVAPPPGTAATGRSRPGPAGPGRGREGRRARRVLARAVGRARNRAYGRERARRRVASGRWDPHPGWRNRVDGDLIVLIDQAAAMRRIEQLVDAELWRADKRESWTRMLRQLVYAMDWTTGLVCGVTREKLAAAGDRGLRTVTSLLAWAQDVDLLVVVETGASKEFLGTPTNRAPAYVLVTNQQPADSSSDANVAPPDSESAQLNPPVEQSCHLPHSSVGSKPLTEGRRLDLRPRPNSDWPIWQIPTTPAQRSAAATTLLARIGLDNPSVPVWRARALLHPWWTAGACVAGLLYAIDHHPDRPAQTRGDALRSATDPLRVLGYRLSAWIGQLHRLSPELAGRHGDYRAQQTARVTKRVAAAEQKRAHRNAQPPAPRSTAAAREQARTAFATVLADRARRRTTATDQLPSPQ